MMPQPKRSFRETIDHMRSENWGGLSGLLGDLTVVAAGDMQSVGAMTAFLAAEYVLIRHGHKSGGYSAGSLLLATGDAILCFSKATAGNPPLRLALTALAVTFVIGSLRYPCEQVAAFLRPRAPETARKLQKSADLIQPIVGGLVVFQHIPVLIFAAIGGNIVMLIAQSFWLVADALIGRLQGLIKPAVQKMRSFFDNNEHEQD